MVSPGPFYSGTVFFNLELCGIFRSDNPFQELTAIKREKFAKNKKNTSKERLSFVLFEV